MAPLRAPSPMLLAALRGVPCKVCQGAAGIRTRHLNSSTTTIRETPEVIIPLRKQLKEEARAKKKAGKTASVKQSVDAWELTVGIEIHAELNTARKLFSPATTSLNDTPNTHVALFDAALPGAQPQFQHETLLPAIRAALALDCKIQHRSGWDRKHYFWWDQPNGYQITQYYDPFAKDGSLTLYSHDDIDPSDGDSITIGIKQVQMEQDTAKTILQPPSTHLLDFNRVSHPLVEIITLPQIHSPKTAAALVRKVQSILKAVGANSTGMEMGGLRADVNVSVRRRADSNNAGLSYAGVGGLGQRTEIKNLSSFKAVEDAIIAERDRQIRVLESGGVIEGETRGWTLGSNETKRLRGKEGEVDYRYMPDPDLGDVTIADDLIEHLRTTLPLLPDEILKLLTTDSTYNLTSKDARTLITIDNGDRLEYYFSVVEKLRASLPPSHRSLSKAGRTVGNWVLHELSSILASRSIPFIFDAPSPTSPTAPSIPSTPSTVPTPQTLALILTHLLNQEITQPTAKLLVTQSIDLLDNTSPSTPSTPSSPSDFDVSAYITANNLFLRPLSDEEYVQLAKTVVNETPEMASKVREEASIARQKDLDVAARTKGKVMWFVGQMVRKGEEGRVQPERAEEWARKMLFEDDSSVQTTP